MENVTRKKATRPLNPMCGNWLTALQSTAAESAHGDDDNAECGACSNKRCKLQKPREEFSLVIAKRGEGVKGDSRVCNSCVERRAKEEADMCRESSEQVEKRQRRE